MKNLVPHFILDNFKKGKFSGSFPAVSLFIDLSGFTEMTEALMQHGKEGTEVLADMLTQVFEPLVNSVYGQAGFITGFAGDAFTAIFPAGVRSSGCQKNASSPLTDEVFLRSLTSAYNIQQYLVKNPTHFTRFGTFTFSAKLGLAEGLTEWGIIASDGEHCQHTYYFKGSAIDRCARAEGLANSGELVISQPVYERLQVKIEARPTKEGHVLLSDIRTGLLSRQPIEWHEADPNELVAFLPSEVVHSTVQGEFRRVVTVFIQFKDVRTERQLQKYMKPVFQSLRQYGGYFARLDFGDKGCNILIFWGAPLYFENNIERALDFMLDLKNTLAGDDTKAGCSFRAGVTQRLMYAGYAGAPLRGEYTCYGRGINLASRHMMKAGWNEIWLCGVIARAAERQFHIEGIGNFAFKGFAEKQPIYILKSRKADSASISYQCPMVGREQEMRQLKRFVQPIIESIPDPNSIGESAQVENQQIPLSAGDLFTGLMAVYGEAGMGKSRLIYEFRQYLLNRYSVWWFFCPADEIMRQSLNPFKHFLKQYFKQSTHQTEAENKQHFETRIDELLNSLHELLSETSKSELQIATLEEIISELERTRSILAAMIDLYYPGSLYSRLEPQLRFENILATFKNLVKGFSLLQPVVLSIDDAQWIDPDSLQLIKVLTRNIDRFPIAIIYSARYRDDGSRVTIDPDQGVQHEVIDLDYLSNQGIKALAEYVLQNRVDKNLIDFLQEKTEGNPFFVEQMTLDLMEKGLLARQVEENVEQGTEGIFKASGPTFHTFNETDLKDVPANINSVLIARLDRLALDVKQVVQTASVLGWEFDTQLLEYMLQHDPDLEPKMKAAAQSAIWSAKTSINYIFKHALMRDAAYEMQLKSRLRELHKMAGQAYEAIYAQDLSTFYADVAFHFEQAAILDKTVTYLQKAGDQAKANYQNQDALDFYDRLLSNLPDSHLEEKIEVGHSLETEPVVVKDVTGLRTDILLNIGGILMLIGKWDKARQVFSKSRASAKKQNDKIRLAKANGALGGVLDAQSEHDQAMTYFEQALKLRRELDDELGIARTLGEIGDNFLKRGAGDQALKYYQERITLSQKLADRIGIAKSIIRIGNIYYGQSNYKKALEYYEEYLKMGQEFDDKLIISKAYANIGTVRLHLGDYEQAAACYRKRLQLNEEIGHKAGISTVLGNLGVLYYYRDDYDMAMEYYQQKTKIDRELGNKAGLCKVIADIGVIHMLKGDYKQATGSYREALAIAEAIGDKARITYIVGNIGGVYKETGDYERALHCFEKQLSLKEELADRQGVSIALTNVGSVYEAKGDEKKALDFYDRAIGIGKKLKIQSYLCRYLNHKANLLFNRQQFEQARVLNVEALQIATDVKQQEPIFLAKVLAAKLDFALGLPAVAIQTITNMLEQTTEDAEKATLHYELLQLGTSSDSHRRQALELYQKLYAKTPKIDYRNRIDELITNNKQ